METTIPTPDRAVALIDKIDKYGDEEVLDAALELVAMTHAHEDRDKFRYEAAWAAIEHGYTKTRDCRDQARRYVGAAAAAASASLVALSCLVAL